MSLGRPRSFEIEDALERAMGVFWRQGYEGASLVDLTAAMGISAPSLYAAFGNKEGLFQAVLDHYDKARAAALAEVLNAPTAREVASRFLYSVADFATDPKGPPGCLLLQCGSSCDESAARIPEEVARHQAEKEAALRERFERAQAEGDLPNGATPAAFARYLIAVSSGMCVQAAAGASREELYAVAELALGPS